MVKCFGGWCDMVICWLWHDRVRHSIKAVMPCVLADMPSSRFFCLSALTHAGRVRQAAAQQCLAGLHASSTGSVGAA